MDAAMRGVLPSEYLRDQPDAGRRLAHVEYRFLLRLKRKGKGRHQDRPVRANRLEQGADNGLGAALDMAETLEGTVQGYQVAAAKAQFSQSVYYLVFGDNHDCVTRVLPVRL